jgi:uncharacterized protein (DUF1697 family)
MIAHIALLRAVNVGNNMLEMEHLREMLAGLGLVDVKTYLQSGNVLFRATGAQAELAAAIEKRVSQATRLPVVAILRTADELRRVVEDNPFANEAAAAPKTVHVTFMAGAAPKGAAAAIGKLPAGSDRWHVAGSEIYLHCPSGYGRTKLNNTALERALGVGATTRNWNTVTALYAMVRYTASAATPGSSRPSSHSRKAPPAVET